jgi:hypothetical protein
VAGQPVQDSWGTVGTGQLGQDSRGRTAGTGQSGQDSWDGTSGTGWLVQDSWDRTARVTTGTGFAHFSFVSVCFEWSSGVSVISKNRNRLF